MKKLLCLCVAAAVSAAPLFAGDTPASTGRPSGSDPIRDSNQKIVGYLQHTATGTVIRDANGKIVASVPPKK